MLMTYESTAGLTTVGYRLINDDKSEDVALTMVGVTEVAAGCYAVNLADTKAGKTILWYEDSTYKASDRVPVQVATTDVITGILASMLLFDSIRMGRGIGSVEVNDSITNGVVGVRDLVVRAFPNNNGIIDWTSLSGRDVTDEAGNYTLFLDPGTYVLSIERAGTQITTIDKIVTPPVGGMG